jgi:hypothetical protein
VKSTLLSSFSMTIPKNPEEFLSQTTMSLVLVRYGSKLQTLFVRHQSRWQHGLPTHPS